MGLPVCPPIGHWQRRSEHSLDVFGISEQVRAEVDCKNSRKSFPSHQEVESLLLGVGHVLRFGQLNISKVLQVEPWKVLALRGLLSLSALGSLQLPPCEQTCHVLEDERHMAQVPSNPSRIWLRIGCVSEIVD